MPLSIKDRLLLIQSQSEMTAQQCRILIGEIESSEPKQEKPVNTQARTNTRKTLFKTKVKK